MPRLGVAVVGAGYWGPNLIRNFRPVTGLRLRWCATSTGGPGARRARVVQHRRGTTDLAADVLADPRRSRRSRSPPRPRTHHDVATGRPRGRQARAGREAAGALARPRGRSWSTAAASAGLVLMCDHTYCYTPAVREDPRAGRTRGVLGDIQYVDSVRINLGLVQPDVDVLWDLAPHDLSILDFILPDERPAASASPRTAPTRSAPARPASATSPCPLGRRHRPRARELAEPRPRSARRSSAAPSGCSSGTTSTRRSGSASTTAGSTCTPTRGARPSSASEALVAYRSGDMVAPALPERRGAAGRGGRVRRRRSASGRAPLTDGRAGSAGPRASSRPPRSSLEPRRRFVDRCGDCGEPASTASSR